MTNASRFFPAGTLSTLIAIPVLGGLMILQTSLLSRFPLLQGTSDLVMLAVIAWALQKRVETAWQWCIIGGLIFSLVSALPVGVALIAYSLITALALILRRHVWQAPLLAMLLTTFLGTVIMHAVSLVAVAISGTSLPFGAVVNLITLPSLLLNLLLAIPIYAIINDLAKWLYPEELEV
jgi:rod shape-determining protein MreD